MKRPRASYDYSQPAYESDMDLWGQTKGEEVWEPVKTRISEVLDANGDPLRIDLKRQALGFDLRGRK